jgi:hypothetical protein
VEEVVKEAIGIRKSAYKAKTNMGALFDLNINSKFGQFVSK